MGPKFYPEASPGDAGKANNLLQDPGNGFTADKIKEDERIRTKDSNKDKVNHQSMFIGNQS